MGGFFNNLMMRFRRFMQGRYGIDNLSRFLMAFALILWAVNILFGFRNVILSVLVAVLLVLVYVRMFSKNIQARYNENTRYLMLKEKLLNIFRGRKGSGSQNGRSGGASGHAADTGHKIFACPACRQRVRVPSGRGKIEITCPKCGNHFKRRT
ncbi:MAG: hypothetical protein IJK86_03685 [Lachnospiraceae bacterium]|nr:hypothetical protein [Lachnospiraceae bacterium]